MSHHPSTPTIGEEANPADEMQPKRIRRFFTNPFRHRRPRAVPVAERPVDTGAGRLGDRVILGFAVAVLLAVAGAAAYVSSHHFYGLAIVQGERRDMAVLYPAMSDGVIVMASLVMVYCSRRRIGVPVLAWVSLTLGGAVTLAANVARLVRRTRIAPGQRPGAAGVRGRLRTAHVDRPQHPPTLRRDPCG
ncbi:DUF2637 domain-containing protein [Nonomuraea zeae]|uniref:DUF2637 domain-containing protein n=1 Tax=Nonomuraea zeae TaxID=1642303 RepID=A0A5S4G0V5_9ACTN|nr:DUF2637 domain-containing protein [Nonomuraea zeae]TMR26623.1 DUF2637 domain-containing protein [Nonomuraea zeae]